MHTQAVEDYLKTIYVLQPRRGRVATTALAEYLGVAPASVTKMVKKLVDMGLAVHKPYQGVFLTQGGQQVAVRVIRLHQLVERYLMEKLGMPIDQAQAHAESWEHLLSAELESRIDAALG
jgi:DtxR family Mn-dependent transcriptional regulator